MGDKTIIAAWIGAVFGLFALTGSPPAVSSGWLSLFMAVAPGTIWLTLPSALRVTPAEAVADELRPWDRSQTR